MTGVQVDCTTNTSEPRTDSWMETAISPSENVFTSLFPTGRPRQAAISAATFGLELAVKILMSLPCKFISFLTPLTFLRQISPPTFFKARQVALRAPLFPL